MRVTDRTPGTPPTSTGAGVASRAAPAAASPARRPFFAPPPPPQGQERVCQQHQRAVVLPTTPAPAFEVVQAQLVLQLLVTVLDPPAALGRPHQPPQRRAGRQVTEE